eukprot:TRINITY_DN1483_c0_g1_i1.p4 TRINITY_DN1483_c0_g1~~TRINITY_DN1483_c0_g1_i1.p4  ORF type:complete len:115 (+),score=15.01 TRINITY_DN1483_c0_g1_i1:535-879(+)
METETRGGSTILILINFLFDLKGVLRLLFFIGLLSLFVIILMAINVHSIVNQLTLYCSCLLYTSDAADDTPCVDLGGRRIIKKKKRQQNTLVTDRDKTKTHRKKDKEVATGRQE